MGYFWSVFIIGPLIISVLFHLSNIPVINLCEIETCPFCYGDDYCKEFDDNITLNYYSFSDFVFNLISVKNVYFGKRGTDSVLIKKLTHNTYFDTLNKDILKFTNISIKQKDVEELLNDKTSKFQVCDPDTANMFLERFNHKNRTNLWTLLKVNVEPLLLEVFSQEDNWALPRLLGYCGRAIVVENCGIPLNKISLFTWYDRAFVAFQLLSAAENFTLDHKEFRLYLLDISPDNIVVNPKNLHVAFIDLEHGLLQRKIVPEFIHHYTHHFDDENYAFSTEQICNSHISDHNVYSVCRLLLSQYAPWPMMTNGLLHSPPPSLDITELFTDIELCVNSVTKLSRFYYSKKIKEHLRLLVREQH